MPRFAIVLAIALLPLTATGSLAQTKPDKDYLVYVVSESADKIALIRFGPNGARIDHQFETGDMPVDIDGPHGIVVSPDREYYYVSIANGRPFGLIWKYSTKDDSVLGKTMLGYFPATVDITPDGNFLFVVNFNLHGDMVSSSVSVVSTPTMTEVARIQTCTMPHGSRLNPQTWAQPSADGLSIYVACNKSSEIVELNVGTWQLVRRIPARAGVYNLAVTHDGTRLLATNKRDQSVSIFDLKSGKELARLPTKRKVLHGVVVTPDDLYAFVTVEGVARNPAQLRSSISLR